MECAFIPAATIEKIGEHISGILTEAREAGRNALLQSDCMRVPSEDTQKMVEYLLRKKQRIDRGGIRGGFEKFVLWINFSTDMLLPVLRRNLTAARAAYLNAFRQCIRQKYQQLWAQIDPMLLCVEAAVRKQRKEAESQISEHIEQQKATELSRIDNELRRLDVLTEFQKG